MRSASPPGHKLPLTPQGRVDLGAVDGLLDTLFQGVLRKRGNGHRPSVASLFAALESLGGATPSFDAPTTPSLPAPVFESLRPEAPAHTEAAPPALATAPEAPLPELALEAAPDIDVEGEAKSDTEAAPDFDVEAKALTEAAPDVDAEAKAQTEAEAPEIALAPQPASSVPPPSALASLAAEVVSPGATPSRALVETPELVGLPVAAQDPSERPQASETAEAPEPTQRQRSEPPLSLDALSALVIGGPALVVPRIAPVEPSATVSEPPRSELPDPRGVTATLPPTLNEPALVVDDLQPLDLAPLDAAPLDDVSGLSQRPEPPTPSAVPRPLSAAPSGLSRAPGAITASMRAAALDLDDLPAPPPRMASSGPVLRPKVERDEDEITELETVEILEEETARLPSQRVPRPSPRPAMPPLGAGSSFRPPPPMPPSPKTPRLGPPIAPSGAPNASGAPSVVRPAPPLPRSDDQK